MEFPENAKGQVKIMGCSLDSPNRGQGSATLQAVPDTLWPLWGTHCCPHPGRGFDRLPDPQDLPFTTAGSCCPGGPGLWPPTSLSRPLLCT